MHVVCAKDPARCNILPAVDHTAVSHRQVSVVPRTHRAELAMNAPLLPFQANTLARSEAAVLDSVSDASLLVELALHNRILRLFGRGGLGKSHGRRCSEWRPKYKVCVS